MFQQQDAKTQNAKETQLLKKIMIIKRLLMQTNND